MIRLTQLTHLGFYLNGALGSGKHSDISIHEVKKRIRDRTIFEYLDERLGEDFDSSTLGEFERCELASEWEDMADVVREGRKLCVDRNGLCLLMGYILEGIQQRYKNQAQVAM